MESTLVNFKLSSSLVDTKQKAICENFVPIFCMMYCKNEGFAVILSLECSHLEVNCLVIIQLVLKNRLYFG
jgi:hypothetical protein